VVSAFLGVSAFRGVPFCSVIVMPFVS